MSKNNLINNVNSPDNSSLINNEKMSKLEQAKFVNIDKSMAAKTLTFTQFGEDETLCRDLLIYICHKYQGNLFSFGTIDINDFCKVMNYRRPHLQVIVPDPFQSKSLLKSEYEKMKKAGEFLWENKFENALYKLNKIEFAWRFSGESPDGVKYTEETGFKFLDSIVVKRTPVGKTMKKLYGFAPNQRFIDNLSRWFLSVNLSAFTSLRSYESLYLYLLLRRHLQHTVNGFKNEPIEFDKVLALSGYDCSLDRQNKFEITKALRKIQAVDSTLSFSFKWVKVNSKYSYSLLLDFTPELKSKEAKIEELLTRFDIRLCYDLLSLFRRLFPECSNPTVSLDSEKETFNSWLWDVNTNFEEKASIYKNAKVMVLGNKAVINPGEERKFFIDRALSEAILYKAS
jgi:hypothetical protein